MEDKSKAVNSVKKIKKELDQGADFAELAQKYSEDAESARKGGDLGYFIRGWMVPAFEKSAFTATVGQVTEPVETEFGYHLILVEEKRAPQAFRLDEDMKESLANYLMQRKFQMSLKEYVSGLRVKADIKIKEELLKAEAPEKKR